MTLHSSSTYYHTLNYYSHEHPFSSYAHSHSIYEEQNTHNEPYGYEIGDDVSDIYMLIVNSLLNNKDKEITYGQLYSVQL